MLESEINAFALGGHGKCPDVLKLLTGEEEELIRKTVYAAIDELITNSGAGMAEIDWMFFSGRKYCPEMTLPECEKCMLNTLCKKNTELFQPVFRTTFY